VNGSTNRRLGRFFRDDEERAASSDLAGTLRGAIEDTDNLFVICSPHSAQSKWVNAEIEHRHACASPVLAASPLVRSGT